MGEGEATGGGTGAAVLPTEDTTGGSRAEEAAELGAEEAGEGGGGGVRGETKGSFKLQLTITHMGALLGL